MRSRVTHVTTRIAHVTLRVTHVKSRVVHMETDCNIYNLDLSKKKLRSKYHSGTQFVANFTVTN